MPNTQSQIQLYNAALIEVGSTQVLGVNDDSKESRTCNAAYPVCRDEVLAARFWNCAMKRSTCARLTAGPGSEAYAYAYQLPVDCLRVKLVEDNDDWKIEGRTVVTDEETCSILYVHRLEDPSQFSPLLFKAVTLRLASMIAFAITRSAELSGRLEAKFRMVLDEAALIDAVEQQGDQSSNDYTENARATDWNVGNPRFRG
jgi:hypothetical protein